MLIVRAGPAGVAAAETLRAEGLEGSILLAGPRAEDVGRRVGALADPDGDV